MDCEIEDGDVVKDRNTNEGVHNTQSSDMSTAKDFENSSFNSEMLKKNQSGFVEELDFEDEPQNIPGFEAQLHVPVSESMTSVRENEIINNNIVESGEIQCTTKAESSDLEGEILSGNASDSVDDMEEGEVKDDSSVNEMTSTVCRFFQRGRCVWGSNCRFFHVTDKGLYNMFDSRPVIPKKTFDVPSMNFFSKDFDKPLKTNFPHPRENIGAVNSVWDRALVEAKEAILRSKARKEEDDFEDKKMYNSFGDELVHFKKYLSSNATQLPRRNANNNLVSSSQKAGYRRYSRSVSHEDHRNKPGNPQDEKQLTKRVVKYISKKSNYSEKWQDPWRRSKSPEKRKRRSRSSSSASSKKSYSERSSISLSSCASSSCSCSGKSASSKSLCQKKVHGGTSSFYRHSRFRSISRSRSRSVSRSRSRRSSCSSISSSSLSSVASYVSLKKENSDRSKSNVQKENHFHRQPSKSNVIRTVTIHSPRKKESRRSRSSSAFRSRSSTTVKSPPIKRRRQNSSDVSVSSASDPYFNRSQKANEVKKTDSVSEKNNLPRTTKRNLLTDNNRLIPRNDNSDKINHRSSVRVSSSENQLKQAVRPLKVQGNKPISEDCAPYSNRVKSCVVLEENERVKSEKLKDLNLLKKRDADLTDSVKVSSSEIQLKKAVHPLKGQGNKQISEDCARYSNLNRAKSSMVLEESERVKSEKLKDLNLLKKRGADLSDSYNNLSNKQTLKLSDESSAKLKQKITKVKNTKLSAIGEDLLKYHSLTKGMRISNNASNAKVQKPSTNPPANPTVTSDCSADALKRQEGVKQKEEVEVRKPKISINLQSKNDKQIKLSDNCLKMKVSKKSNVPPQTSRREQLLKQLKAVEDAIARKKTTF